MRLLRRLALAIGYVTCLPLLSVNSTDQSQESLSGLAKYLPAVGILLGLWMVGLDLLLGSLHTGHILCCAIITIAWLVLTNGLHFDGLMDTADGIFSHQSPERALEIMQDPRVGNFGVLAGVSVLLLKFIALFSIPVPYQIFALIFVPAWSRWAETFAISAFPYLKPQGKGKIWHDSTKHPRDIFISGLVPSLLVATACALGYWPAALMSAFTALGGVAAAFWLNKKLGGQTGDTYGCVVEIAEACGLVLSAIAVPFAACGT
jgi:adenosylcobinamide-GDP ribazoletransferase